MSSCPQKKFNQCFWHADGSFTCQDTVVPTTTPNNIVQFNTFTQGNENYKPTAYRNQTEWYNKRRQPCCSVPCRQGCDGSPPSAFSPPRDADKMILSEDE